MRGLEIKYTNEVPNRIFEINGKVTINELQELERQIKANSENVCKHGTGLYHFRVFVTSGADTMILTSGAEYRKGHEFILTMINYDPND